MRFYYDILVYGDTKGNTVVESAAGATDHCRPHVSDIQTVCAPGGGRFCAVDHGHHHTAAIAGSQVNIIAVQ